MCNLQQFIYSGFTVELKNENYDSQWADNYGV